MGIYKDTCGNLPVSTTFKEEKIRWWICAFDLAQKRGVCSDTAGMWSKAVESDINIEEGKKAYILGFILSPLPGGVVEINIVHNGRYRIGIYLWSCDAEREQPYFTGISESYKALVGDIMSFDATLLHENGDPIPNARILIGKNITSQAGLLHTDANGKFLFGYKILETDVPRVDFFFLYSGSNVSWASRIDTSVIVEELIKDCPAYGLLNGEVTCMERDLWKCENGEMVKIEENSPECKEVEPGNGPACPIACVCMGTPLIDQLGPIREFRDEVLKMSRAGRIFVLLYYGKLSPHLSPLLEKSETLRRVGRILVRGILWMTRK